MKLLPKWDEKDEEKDTKAGCLQVLVIPVILAGLIYSEVMFLSIVSVAFPAGIVGNLAVVGALCTGASCFLLYFAKQFWFLDETPQFYAGAIFAGIEVLIMFGNDAIAFMIMTHRDLGWFSLWPDITAASPLVSIVGWFVVVYLDPRNQMKQKRMKAAQSKKKMALDYEMTVFETQYNLQKEHLQQVSVRVDDAMASPAVQKKIEEHAQRLVAKVLTEATGLSAFSKSGEQKTIDSSATPVSLAQTAQVPKQDPQ